MKSLTNMNVLLFIAYVCAIAHTAHSYSILDQESADENTIEHEYPTIENPSLVQLHPYLSKRRTDSAEKYFHWASKTNRPMEYLRGKRFWLFTKKDENDINHELAPSSIASSNQKNQGIWRSGIVGRRRR